MAASDFQSLLSRARVRFGIAGVIRAVSILFVIALSIFVLLLHIFKAAGPSVLGGIGIFLTAAAAVIVFAVAAYKLSVLLKPSGRAFARALEERLPELGTTVSHTAELEQELQPGASQVLAVKYVKDTERRLSAALKKSSLIEGCRYFFIALTSLAFLLVALFKLNGSLLNGWQVMYNMLPQIESRENRALPDVKLPPVVLGNIFIRYEYPAYSGITPKEDSLTAGRIRALKGTAITMRATVSRQIEGIKARTSGGETIPVKTEGRNILLTMSVFRSDALEIFTQADSGKQLTIFRDTVIADPDMHPSIDLIANSPLTELRKKERIQLTCRASDDFGLRFLRLIVVQGERETEEKIALTRLQRDFRGDVELDLSRFVINPGEGAYVVAEVTDNDAVSGYKRVRSAPLALTVMDEAKVKEEFNVRLKELESKMVNLLADHLEFGFVQGFAREKARHISAALDAKTYSLMQLTAILLSDMKFSDDIMSDDIYSALETFAARLGAAADSRRNAADKVSYGGERESELFAAEEREIKELEDIIIKLDDIRSDEKVDDIMEIADELNRRGRELSEKMKNMKDSEKIRELKNELAKLQKDLADLFNKLMDKDNKSGLPEEFLNDDALKQLPMDQLSETLDKIQKALEAGDTKTAEAEMAKLRDLMDQMASSVASAESNYQNEEFERRMEILQNAMKDLDKLIERQSKLNSQSEKRLAENAEELRKMMEEMMKNGALSDSALAAALAKMAGEQGSIMKKMEALAKGLEGMEGGPEGESGEGGQMEGDMKGAMSGLGSSYNQMSKYNLPGSIPSAQKGLYHMMRLKEGLKESMNSMSKGRKSGSGQGGAMGSKPDRGNRKGGKSGTATGPIELVPEGKQGKMREMINDAIKEEAPKNYQNENRKYYEQLGN
ncbi:MAG: hypothetical protein JNL74_10160 [Fibrobacteres bacterium]|nr:hypothetical protein [Fibrobacterota bacterium]